MRRAIVPPELKAGPFTLVEAQQAGLTRSRLRGASWRRVGRGLYVWAGLNENPAVTLAAVHRRLPAGAAFSGRTAAWLHGLDLPPCDPVEVTIPRQCGISRLAGVSVSRTALSRRDIVVRRSLPATSALRTVLDLARRPPLVEAVVVVDMALHRRLVAVDEVRSSVSHQSGRSGVAQLRRVLDLAEPLAESPMETRLRLLLVLGGLPRPRAQVPLHDERGRFLGRPDLYYADRRLGIEYDGGTHRDSLADDDRRQNRLLDAGYRLLRFTARDINRPDAVAALVARQLGATLRRACREHNWSAPSS
jgi:very-short-patch-repair endonuclease